MIEERSGPAQVSTHCPSAGPRVALRIHIGGGLPNNAVYGGWLLRSMLGNEQDSIVRKSPGVLGKVPPLP